MPRVIWSGPATEGLLRAFSFLDEFDVEAAAKALHVIVQGVKILERFPEAGRPAEDLESEQKELLIPFGSSGYLVLYEIEGESVLILAVRHQREAGY